MIFSASRTLLPLLCLAALSGCGGDGLERAPITGLVTIDGQPLDLASVQFMPAPGTPGEGALGNSDPAGKFEVVSSRRDDSGIPPGEYTVRVTRFVKADGTAIPPEEPQADYPDSYESVPPPFSGMASPLKVVIPKEGGEVKVEIPAKLYQRKARK